MENPVTAVEAFTTAITSLKTDALAILAVAVPVALAIWAGPKVIRWAQKWFTSFAK